MPLVDPSAPGDPIAPTARQLLRSALPVTVVVVDRRRLLIDAVLRASGAPSVVVESRRTPRGHA
jgi:hypothetical protein